MAKKVTKSTRDRPEIYSEVKTSVYLAVIRTVIVKPDKLASSMGLSRSKFVKQTAHELIYLNLKKIGQYLSIQFE